MGRAHITKGRRAAARTFLESATEGGAQRKKWEPMRVTVVGRVTEVVLNGGKHSGKGSGTSGSFSFPSWWWGN